MNKDLLEWHRLSDTKTIRRPKIIEDDDKKCLIIIKRYKGKSVDYCMEKKNYYNTPSKILDMIEHLTEKVWCDNKIIHDFIIMTKSNLNREKEMKNDNFKSI